MLRMSSNIIIEMNLKPCSHEKPEADDAKIEESARFDKSLKELRELRGQLHHAADYSEATFSKSKEKKDVLESTKEYICKTMVTIVDHLGNVSANLEVLISQTNAFSEAELRIQCLQQRFLWHEKYAHKLSLSKLQWSENLPRFHSRYLLSTPTVGRSSSEKLLRDSENQFPSKLGDKHAQEADEELPLFMYTHKPHPAQNLKPTTAVNHHNNLALVVPVRDGLTVFTKVPNPKFNFQSKSTQKVGRHSRSLYGSDILWPIRRSKRIQ